MLFYSTYSISPGDNLSVDKKHTIVHGIYKAVYTRGDKGCCQKCKSKLQ